MLSAVCGAHSADGMTETTLFPCPQAGRVCRGSQTQSRVGCYRRGPRPWWYRTTERWSWWLQIQQACSQTGSGRKTTALWKPGMLTLQELYWCLAAGKEAELKPSTAEPPAHPPMGGVTPSHLQDPQKQLLGSDSRALRDFSNPSDSVIFAPPEPK